MTKAPASITSKLSVSPLLIFSLIGALIDKMEPTGLFILTLLFDIPFRLAAGIKCADNR